MRYGLYYMHVDRRSNILAHQILIICQYSWVFLTREMTERIGGWTICSDSKQIWFKTNLSSLPSVIRLSSRLVNPFQDALPHFETLKSERFPSSQANDGLAIAKHCLTIVCRARHISRSVNNNCWTTNKQISIFKSGRPKKKKINRTKEKGGRNTKGIWLASKVLLSKLFNELFVYTYLYT